MGRSAATWASGNVPGNASPAVVRSSPMFAAAARDKMDAVTARLTRLVASVPVEHVGLEPPNLGQVAASLAASNAHGQTSVAEASAGLFKESLQPTALT